jgi:hypothetical protein
MSMKVCFRLHYQKDDVTHTAIRLASFAQAIGLDPIILPRSRPASVDSYWDRNANRHTKLKFNEYIKKGGISHIIFLSTADPEELKAAQKAGIKTILYIFWDAITAEDTNLYHIFNHVVCPSRRIAKLMAEKMGLDNLHAISYDPDVPITNDYRIVDPRKIKLFWSLDGSQCVNTEPKFMTVIESVLKQNPNISITVTYNNILPPQGVVELTRISTSSGGRVNLIVNPSWDKQQLLYGQHDLTIWPSLVENVGLVGLCSLYMSTPVIAFDHPIIGEIVKDNKNGELVPCDLILNWLGVPYVQANYPVFTRQLLRLVDNTEKLSQMREWASSGLRERQASFVSKWLKLMDYDAS